MEITRKKYISKFKNYPNLTYYLPKNLKGFPPANHYALCEYPINTKQPSSIRELQLYLTFIGFSNHREMQYAGKPILVGELPQGWIRNIVDDYELIVSDPTGKEAIKTTLGDKEGPIYDISISYFPEDPKVLNAYVKKREKEIKDIERKIKFRKFMGKLTGKKF